MLETTKIPKLACQILCLSALTCYEATQRERQRVLAFPWLFSLAIISLGMCGSSSSTIILLDSRSYGGRTYHRGLLSSSVSVTVKQSSLHNHNSLDFTAKVGESAIIIIIIIIITFPPTILVQSFLFVIFGSVYITGSNTCIKCCLIRRFTPPPILDCMPLYTLRYFNQETDGLRG